jgi:hypothetical protein
VSELQSRKSASAYFGKLFRVLTKYPFPQGRFPSSVFPPGIYLIHEIQTVMTKENLAEIVGIAFAQIAVKTE